MELVRVRRGKEAKKGREGRGEWGSGSQKIRTITPRNRQTTSAQLHCTRTHRDLVRLRLAVDIVTLERRRNRRVVDPMLSHGALNTLFLRGIEEAVGFGCGESFSGWSREKREGREKRREGERRRGKEEEEEGGGKKRRR